MTTDAWLAIAHHLAVFSLLAVLAAEWGAVRPGLDAAGVARLARIDSLYGAAAGLVVTVGVLRVIFGAKPADFYLENPVFWVKMAAIAAVGITSIGPTRRYLGWRRDGVAPSAIEIAAVRRLLWIQLAIFAVIPTAAAIMARGIGR